MPEGGNILTALNKLKEQYRRKHTSPQLPKTLSEDSIMALFSADKAFPSFEKLPSRTTDELNRGRIDANPLSEGEESAFAPGIGGFGSAGSGAPLASSPGAPPMGGFPRGEFTEEELEKFFITNAGEFNNGSLTEEFSLRAALLEENLLAKGGAKGA